MLKPFFSNKETIECGCDEAGRGCLAGPVVAAAVILPQDFSHPLLNDSKKLSDKQRRLLRPIIEENAIAHSVAFVNNEEIDKILDKIRKSGYTNLTDEEKKRLFDLSKKQISK